MGLKIRLIIFAVVGLLVAGGIGVFFYMNSAGSRASATDCSTVDWQIGNVTTTDSDTNGKVGLRVSGVFQNLTDCAQKDDVFMVITTVGGEKQELSADDTKQSENFTEFTASRIETAPLFDPQTIGDARVELQKCSATAVDGVCNGNVVSVSPEGEQPVADEDSVQTTGEETIVLSEDQLGGEGEALPEDTDESTDADAPEGALSADQTGGEGEPLEDIPDVPEEEQSGGDGEILFEDLGVEEDELVVDVEEDVDSEASEITVEDITQEDQERLQEYVSSDTVEVGEQETDPEVVVVDEEGNETNTQEVQQQSTSGGPEGAASAPDVAQGYTNVALRKNVITHTNNVNYRDAVNTWPRIVDGNYGANWLVNTSSGNGTIADIDLGKRHYISHFRYKIGWDSRFGNKARIEMYLSDDKETWRLFNRSDVENDPSKLYTVYRRTSADRNARYIRFRWTKAPGINWNGWGNVYEVEAFGRESTPPGVDCRAVTKDWRISSITPRYTNGKVGYTIRGSFPNTKECLRRKYNGRGFSAVYTYKGSYGTEDRGFYAYKSDEVESVTDRQIVLKPKYTYSNGTHTFWLMHCRNKTTNGSCTGGWGRLTKNVTIQNPSPAGTNCQEAGKQWRISSITPNYTNGKVGYTIRGNFPNTKECLRRKYNGRGFSAVYTYKGSYGTEDRGFYAYKSDEVLSVTDKKIILKPKYTYSDGVHTFWLMHCNNRTTDGSCTGGWGTVRKKITISNPSPETNCTEATKRWKISAIKPNYTDGKVGFTIDGNFPNSRDCLRRQLAGRGFSAVYTFKGSYGTEPRGYYAYKTDQVQSVTDTRIILKPRYTYSEGTHTFWVLYCTGNATNGVCKGSSGAKASTVKISKQSDKDSAQVDLTVGKTGTEGVENTSAGFSVRVCNQGQGSSNGKYKLEVINNTNTSKKYRTSGSWDVPAPGRCGSVISFDSYPCGRLGIDCDGSYDITVKVDPEDNISETNENNNTKQFSHASDPGGCKSNSDCSGNTPVCDAEKNTCVECTSNGDCKSGERCNVSLGKCEQGQTDCTTKQYGDANCDGKYDLSNDFMEWRAEFRASATDESHTNDADGDGDNWDADFDDDGGVRISDFSIWRSSFQKVQRGTPVP